MSRSSQVTLQHFAVPLILAPLLGAYFFLSGGEKSQDAQKQVASAPAPSSKDIDPRRTPAESAKDKVARANPSDVETQRSIASEMPPALGTRPPAASPRAASEIPPTLGGSPTSGELWRPSPPPSTPRASTPPAEVAQTPRVSPFKEVPSGERSPLAIAQEKLAAGLANLSELNSETAPAAESNAALEPRDPAIADALAAAAPATASPPVMAPTSSESTPPLWRPPAVVPQENAGPDKLAAVEAPESAGVEAQSHNLDPQPGPEAVASLPAAEAAQQVEQQQVELLPQVESLPQVDRAFADVESQPQPEALADARPLDAQVDQIRRPERSVLSSPRSLADRGEIARPLADSSDVGGASPETPDPALTAEAHKASTVGPSPLAVDRFPAPNFLAPPGLLLLENPESNSLQFLFLLNGKRHELEPGERRLFVGGPNWTLTFDRGGDFGSAQNVLDEGAYRFRVAPDGWSIFRTPSVSPSETPES